MTTILAALQNADYNLQNGKIPFQVEIAKAQLHNAVTLLEKNYPLEAEMDGLLSEYPNIEDAPQYDISKTI